MASFRRPGFAPTGSRAWVRNALRLRVLVVAATLGATAPATAQAGPDPCTGVGVVTCSGNQSAGVDNPPPGTTLLNVNSLTSDIAPPPGSGQPGILYFGTGDIALNSATGRFRIVTSDDFVDGIVAQSDGAVKAGTSGAIAINGLFANGINLLSYSGGTVTLASSSDISLAQGGNGILAYSDGTVGLTSSGAISVTGDGTGINATAGNRVTVTSSGPISIAGDGDAIDAADIGGPSGGGGVTVNSSGAISLTGSTAIAINASSEDIDPVNVTSSSNITLTKGGAGIVASGLGAISVASSGAISVAGGPGAGIAAASGDVGTVNVTSSGGISMEGDGVAIIAVSVGGTADIMSTGNLLVTGDGIGISAVGGSNASVNSSGSVSVDGDGNAIHAIADTGAANVKSLGNASLGGDGIAIAAVSDGGAANVMSAARITVGGSGTGIEAEGKLAQVNTASDISVMKGGTGITASGANGASVASSGVISVVGKGNAIAASSTAGAAKVTSSGALSVGSGTGIDATGTLAQIASSGDIAVKDGGTGISASGGSQVAVNSSGNIAIGTTGTAIKAVSAGGAAKVMSSGNLSVGGSGTGIDAAGSLAQIDSSNNISIGNGGTGISANGANGASVNSSGVISIGGTGTAIAASSSGGAANVMSSGRISIGSGTGIAATGNLAQVNASGDISLANGTGISATGANQAAVASAGKISIAKNGDAINAVSAGGAADVTSSGNLSIGGGTGIAAQGKLAHVNSTGDISVVNGGAGISASGIDQVAVNSSGRISVGGELGAGISASGTGKESAVNINSSGDVTASGAKSTAILAQAASGDIAVNISGGTITGGSGTGAGIALIGGGDNTFVNAGTITTSPGLGGTAILGMPAAGAPASSPVIGNNVVNNTGTVIGNVDLGPGHNAFNNLPGGTLNSGATLALGAGNTFTNNGNLSPGGAGVFQTTALTGNLVQGGAGRITVDVNPATGQTDRINASGSAQLAGQVVVNPVAAAIPTVTTPFTILHADGGVTNQGLTLAGGGLFSSAVVTPELALLDPDDLAFLVAVNYAPSGLNGNQTAIGENINAIQAAGSSPGFQPVAQALVAIPDLASLGQAYNQLSPETYGDNKIADFYSGLRFANSLMSCDTADGRYVFIKEGQCVWAQIGGKFLDLNANSGSLGFSENAFVMAAGAEMMLRPNWFASFAFGYDHGNLDTDSLAQSQANRAHFGAAIKYNPGPLLLAAAVYGGYGWYTTDRFINFENFNAIATSDSGISRIGGQFRAAYLVDRETWYLKPLVDLNVTRVNLNGFGEQGAGGADLIVSGSGSTVFSASPAVEVGTQAGLQNGVLVRPFARFGMTAFSNTDFAVDASFSGAPAAVPSFQVNTGIDSVTADVAAGADFFLPQSPWALKLAYGAHYGARVRDQGFTLKASLRF